MAALRTLATLRNEMLTVFVALEYGQWLVLEPVMKVEVVAPVEFQGSVLGSLTKRHGVVIGQDSTEGYCSVLCEVCCIATVV